MDNKYELGLRKEFEKFNYHNLDDNDHKKALIALYAYYNYFNADSSKIDDLVNGLLYDKDSRDCIDGIYIDEEADQKEINLLISVPQDEEGKLKIPTIFTYFGYAEEAYFEAIKKNKGRPEVLQRTKDGDFKANEVKPLVVILVTDYTPKNSAEKKKILSYLDLDAYKPKNGNVQYKIVFGNLLESEILEIEDPREFVQSGYLQMDSSGKYVTYGEENSLLVNISALSLKELYSLYCYRGLFSQNLRYYVKNAKIDEEIVNSIQKKPKQFWYFNNGIIIICEDYEIKDGKIYLSDFSIINGGQTTYLIGETDFDVDFFVPCKIIKTPKDHQTEFIADVAQASNTQKPIKPKDLIANRKEQRYLKTQLSDVGVFCMIKRGQRVNKKLYPLPSQNTSNDELAQFLYSFLYQRPGTAKTNRTSLIDNDDKYSLIFGKTYDTGLLTDILLLKMYYKMWTKERSKDAYTDTGAKDVTKLSLYRCGQLFMLAIFGALIKVIYHENYFNDYRKASSQDDKFAIFSQYDIDHSFLKEGLTKEDYFHLFDFLYNDFYFSAFNIQRTYKANNSAAHFTNSDANYQTFVLTTICNFMLSDEQKAELHSVLRERTDEEKERDERLPLEYCNTLAMAFPGKESRLSEGLIGRISTKLADYRSKMCLERNLKPYEIFSNRAKIYLQSFGVDSLEELKNLKLLNKQQFADYGEDILAIIKKEKEL